MLDKDILKAIQIISLKEIEEEKFNQWYNYICRWYSREFATPLEQVLDMADETIIRTYFEDTFYNIYHSDNDKAIQLWDEIKQKIFLSESDQEALEEDDDAFLNEIVEKSQKIREKEKKEVKSTTNDVIPPDDPNLIKEESFQLSGEGIDNIPDFFNEDE
jgi:hypothetical protein